MRIYKKKDNKVVAVPKEEQVQRYKFSWIELISNAKTGETSATGLCGMILIFVALFLFVVLVVWYFFNMSHSAEIFEILDKLTTWMSVGAGLLGLRKLSASFSGGSSFSLGGRSKKVKGPAVMTDEDIDGEDIE